MSLDGKLTGGKADQNPSARSRHIPLTSTGFGIIGVTILLIIASAVAFQDNLFRWTINPRTPFQTYTPPPAPDYTQAAAWAARPLAPPPGAWETPWGVDVFFIHPSTYYSGAQWNAPIDDPEAVSRLETEALPNHARPFVSGGALYAPRYRQATLLSELNFGEDSLNALRLAYSDVLTAFDAYMANDNQGRAIMLVGVGQGGLHAQRLLTERFSNTPLQERLVAAYLIDSATPLDLFESTLSGLEPCSTVNQIQCVISWGAITDGDDEQANRFRQRSKSWTEGGGLRSVNARRTLCVNPILWNTGSDFTPKRIHRGGARATGLEKGVDPAILPAAVATQCVDGVLVVDRPRESQLRRQFSLGAKFKTPDFNLFYADIAVNAAERARLASAWLDEYGAKPAPPLPPVQAIEIKPLTEVQDAVVNPSFELRGRE